jgi:hypothetical protein
MKPVVTLLHCRASTNGVGAAICALFATLISPWAVDANPQITSWYTNGAAQYARVYTNSSGRTAGISGTTWTNQSLPVYSDIQVIAYSSSWIYVQSSGLASYVMGEWTTPQGNIAALWPSNQKSIRRFPRSPAVQAGTKDTTPAAYSGIFVNGVAIFNSLDGKAWNGTNDVNGAHTQSTYYWHRNAPEAETFDGANGHQPPNGIYHTHQNPLGVRYQLGDHVSYNSSTKLYSESTNATLVHSPILGWAHDGYPVYGPYGYGTATDTNSAIRRMVSGYAKRDGTGGTDNLSTNLNILPAWYARYRQAHFGGAYTNFATTARRSIASASLGTYAEDWAYLGDCGKTQAVDFDLDEYNGRYCKTPEYPSGTYAYFITIDATGNSVYPYTFAYEFYGNATGGEVTSITENVTTNFVGGQHTSVKLNSPSVNSSTVTLVWSSVEGGTYSVETSTNQTTWTTLITNVVAKSATTTTNFTGSNGTSYARVTRTALADYDSVYTGGTSTQTASQSYTLSLLGISGHPQSQALAAGSTASFSVTASGVAPFSYQWRKNAANISGATNSNYSIENITAANEGTYSVVVTNSYGSITSSNAVLTVQNSAPTLSSVNTLFAQEDTAYTISYAALAAAADEQDSDNDSIRFRIESVTSGSLTKDNVPVVNGSTLLGENESWVWTPATNAMSITPAFTIRAWDGEAASSSAIQVSVLLTNVNDAPVLSFDTAPINYTEDDGPVFIVSAASVTDVDNVDFQGGNLTVAFPTGSTTNDFLLISPDGTGAGQISVFGNTVSYGGSLLGTYSQGTNGSALVVTFTTDLAIPEVVQKLITRIIYENTSQTPLETARGLQFSLNDGDGGSVSLSKNISIVSVNDTPSLKTVSTLSGASEDTPFTISYQTLAAAANESDADNDPIAFRVQNVTSGTLKKSSVMVTPGTTLLESGESWVWTPPTNSNGTLPAFTIVAWDGSLASTNAVQVSISVSAEMTRNLTLSKNGSTNGLAEVYRSPYGNNVVTFQGDSVDAAMGQSFILGSAGTGNVGWQITSLSIRSQADQTIYSNSVWTLTLAEWQPSTNLANLQYWTNGTDANSLAGFVSPNIIVQDSGSFASNVSFSGSDILTVTFATNRSYYLESNKAYAAYFSIANMTNTFRARAAHGDGMEDGVALWNPVGSPSTYLQLMDIDLYLDGAPVTSFNTAPTLTTISTLSGATNGSAFTIDYATLANAANESDADGNTIYFRVETVADGTLTKNGAAVEPGVTLLGSGEELVWTPSSDGTVTAFTVKAWDGSAASAVPINVQVNVASAPTVTPYISNPSYASSQFQMTFVGNLRNYDFQYSIDLAGWTTLSTFVGAPGGTLLIDSNATNVNAFYRVIESEND